MISLYGNSEERNFETSITFTSYLCVISYLFCIPYTGHTIELSGIDLLDGTPIIDVKPYIPQYDSQETTNANLMPAPMIPPHHSSASMLTSTLSEQLSTRQDEDVKADDRESFVEQPELADEQPELDSNATPKEVKRAKLCKLTGGDDSIKIDSNADTLNLNLSTNESDHHKVAPWVNKACSLQVRFTPSAQKQLDVVCAHQNTDSLITSNVDVLNAITHILQSDPRSVYRKQKCADRLYYFSVDHCHVTCWFDDQENAVEVVKIKPDPVR